MHPLEHDVTKSTRVNLVMDGETQWTGTLGEFVHMNSIEDAEAAQIARALSEGRYEGGGGAFAEYTLTLA